MLGQNIDEGLQTLAKNTNPACSSQQCSLWKSSNPQQTKKILHCFVHEGWLAKQCVHVPLCFVSLFCVPSDKRAPPIISVPKELVPLLARKMSVNYQKSWGELEDMLAHYMQA